MTIDILDFFGEGSYIPLILLFVAILIYLIYTFLTSEIFSIKFFLIGIGIILFAIFLYLYIQED